MHEESTRTFHGREQGYMYRDHSHEKIEPLGYHVEEPFHGVRHGETFGPDHHAVDHFEATQGTLA